MATEGEAIDRRSAAWNLLHTEDIGPGYAERDAAAKHIDAITKHLDVAEGAERPVRAPESKRGASCWMYCTGGGPIPGVYCNPSMSKRQMRTASAIGPNRMKNASHMYRRIGRLS